MTYTRIYSLGNYLPTYLVEAMHILNRNFFGRAITYLFHFQCWCQNSILAQKTRYLIRGTLQKFCLEVIYLIMGFATTHVTAIFYITTNFAWENLGPKLCQLTCLTGWQRCGVWCSGDRSLVLLRILQIFVGFLFTFYPFL